MWADLAQQGFGTLGLNATADAQTRFAVAAEGTLLIHGGGDHRLRINRAADDDTASLLFQTDFNGHAEMGLAGEDAFSTKISADGIKWVTAMRFDPAASAASGDAVQQNAVGDVPGRLILAQHGVLPGDIVGAVTQLSGQPTGAIIERSTTAAGNVIKSADGATMTSRTVRINIGGAGPQDLD
ncbi:MAG: hypothetical protein AAF216_01320 [Pseudomonadota bacterium]